MIEYENSYEEALNKFKDHVDDLHALTNDPFKAPEQIVEFTKVTLNQIWELQMEYLVMMRSGKGKREKDAKI